jgi:hypothetical protein
MRLITICNQDDSEDPDAYWRRRFFILGGGLAVLMLLAWVFGGGGPSKQSARTAAVRASMAAREASTPLPTAALGSPSPLPSASVTPPHSPSATAPGKQSESASGKPGASASPSQSSPAKGAGGSSGKCANGIVLSLFSSQQVYRPSQEPRFSVYAVSTSSSGCQMPYGPGAVRVVVTRHGRMVWDSSACEMSGKPGTVDFAQGVPQEVTVRWNRKASSQACAGSLSSGGSGTFQAVASADGHSSLVRTFRLLS